MVHFGRRLLSLQHGPWKSHYIDYNRLKRILEQPSDGNTFSSDEPFDHRHEITFIDLLDSSIEDTVLFSLQEQGKVASKMALLKQDRISLRAEIQNLREDSDDTDKPHMLPKIRGLRQSYREIGEQIYHLIRFSEVNLTATRKILKKHDRIYHDNKLTSQYLSNKFWGGVDSHLKQLHLSEAQSALVASLKESFSDLHLLQRDLEVHLSHAGMLTRRTNTAPDLGASINDEWNLALEQLEQAPTRTATVDDLSMLKNDNFYANEPIILKIQAVQKRLQETSDFVSILAAPAMVDAPPADTLSEHGLNVRPTYSPISNFLNLLSTFLYLANYFIAAPTSGAYGARLSGSKGLAGLVMGMTPLAALMGTLLYSYWTSFSYKAALIFAAGSAIVGNVLYGLALPYDSLILVLVGRLLIGFGSCRSINRRYIADSYSREDRTAASAAFVTAGSLGMAAGPAFAALLNLLPPDNLWLSVENAPGWLMFGLWALYLVFLITFFRDPPKNNYPPSKAPAPTTTPSERTRLLIPSESRSSDDSASLSFWENIAVPTTLVICFLFKMTLECCMTSTETVTSFYFGWSPSTIGVYLALLGLLMFPANLLVAYCSRRYDDRDLMMATLVGMLVGIIGMIDYGGVGMYSEFQYVLFNVMLFVSANALEAPNMSLLSKAIPSRWSQGFFNVGLLATEAGTLGRTVGDMMITWFGLGGIETLLNCTFMTMGILVGCTVMVTARLFPRLLPRDTDN